MIKKTSPGFILPSAAFTIKRPQVRYYQASDKAPEVGDLIYGVIDYIGQHSSLENKQGRIHIINHGTKGVFVFGNRYAPDYYEAVIPEVLPKRVDLIARSGIVSTLTCKNSNVKDPSRIKIYGYICDERGNILNTRQFPRISPKIKQKKPHRAKLILNIGTAMNSGKTMSAAACCWALATMDHDVRASKVTGTASLKDILHMEDNGASAVTDFSYLGYPSTYLLEEADLVNIFDTLDLKHANNPRNYWVVEFADGMLQRETAMLLNHPNVRSRVHKLIFSAHDASGAIGGLRILKDRFDIVPDAISGICSSSPLGIRELQEYTDLPVFNNVQRDLNQLAAIIV